MSPVVIVVIVLAVLAALLMVAAMAAFVLLPVISGPLQRPQESRAIGQRLPRLELQPLIGDGGPIALADLAGKVVLVNFWGTWCPPCRMEFPHIAAMERKFRDNPDFKLLAVSCSQGVREDLPQLRADTAAFLRQQGVEMPIYADPDGISRIAYDNVGGWEGYPTTLILDRQSVIRGVWVGYYPGTERQMEEMVESLLQNR
jgi:thiol-disulfide isomerase/thioredoxin